MIKCKALTLTTVFLNIKVNKPNETNKGSFGFEECFLSYDTEKPNMFVICVSHFERGMNFAISL